MSSNQISMSKEGIKVLIGKFVAALSGLVGIIVYANILGASGLGLYYLSHAVATILSKPSEGLGIASEKKGSEIPTNISSYNSTSFMLVIVYVTFISIILFLLYNNLSYLNNSLPRQTIVYLTIILVILFSIFSVLSRFYSGMGEPGDSVIIDAYRGIVETGLQITLLVVYGMGVEGLLIGTAISLILSIIYLLFMTRISFDIPDKNSIKDIYLFSKWSIPTKTIKDIYYRMDTIIIGLILTPAAVGIYEAAMRIITPSKYVAYAIERPLLVRVSQDRANNKPVNHLLDDIVPYASILPIPLAIGGYFVGSELLEVMYGSEFSSGFIILTGGAIYFAIHSHSNVLSEYLHGFNAPRPVTKSVIIGSIVRFVLLIVFASFIGLTGVAIAIIIAESIRFTILVISVDKVCSKVYKPVKVINQIKSGIIMGFVIFVISIIPYQSDISLLIVTIPIGGIVYFSVLIYTDRKIKNYLQDNIKIV